METLEGDILHIKQAIEAKKAPMMVSISWDGLISMKN